MRHVVRGRPAVALGDGARVLELHEDVDRGDEEERPGEEAEEAHAPNGDDALAQRGEHARPFMLLSE